MIEELGRQGPLEQGPQGPFIGTGDGFEEKRADIPKQGKDSPSAKGPFPIRVSNR